ncbi:MAG: hypothetical protein WC592_08675 [Candidatus Omnitrophota bacterium]
MKRFLAFICQICPFCIFSRRFPNSGFAVKMKEAEKACPCCKAYEELIGKKKHP